MTPYEFRNVAAQDYAAIPPWLWKGKDWKMAESSPQWKPEIPCESGSRMASPWIQDCTRLPAQPMGNKNAAYIVHQNLFGIPEHLIAQFRLSDQTAGFSDQLIEFGIQPGVTAR